MTRLANVLRKAQRGEEVTIGFIGGSITEGYDASSKDNSYVSLVYKWWCEAFPLTKVNLVNAGVGGTSSYLGVHRVGEDMLSHNPDLVFIEFAVMIRIQNFAGTVMKIYCARFWVRRWNQQ